MNKKGFSIDYNMWYKVVIPQKDVDGNIHHIERKAKFVYNTYPPLLQFEDGERISKTEISRLGGALYEFEIIDSDLE